MAQLSDMTMAKEATGYFSALPNAAPTLDDLLNRVGSDFTVNYMQQRQAEDEIRRLQSRPGSSGKTLLSSIRSSIGDGLRTLADKYFTPGQSEPYSFPGYKRLY